jgi:hypothetical protein
MSNNNNHIAETIINQLGGNKFIAMTGSKDFLWDDEKLTLTFSLSRMAQEKSRDNRIRIQYDYNRDLYNISLCKYLTPTLKRIMEKRDLWKVLKSVDGVFFDQLQEFFCEWTDLDIHL